MKKIFIQDWGTYKNETLVCIGTGHKEVLRFINSHGIQKRFKKWILGNEELFKSAVDRKDNGFFLFNEGMSLLWLKDWKNDWEHYDTLLHELNHAVYFILGNSRLMNAEPEGLAYQQEYLFREIRHKLAN